MSPRFPPAPQGDVCICTSEFAMPQINQLHRSHIDDNADRASCSNAFCDEAHFSRYLSDVSMIAKTFEVTVASIPMLAATCCGNIQIDVIVNDFPLPTAERKDAVQSLIQRPPPLFLDILSAAGQTYEPNGDHGRIFFENDGAAEFRFVRESWLRNRARKLNRRLVAGGRAAVTQKGIDLDFAEDQVSVLSDAQFAHDPLHRLTLAGANNVPLCTSILMAYFHARMHARTIFNVADYNWKCGYRSGALAFMNALATKTTIHNLFFFAPDDDAFIHDEIATQSSACLPS